LLVPGAKKLSSICREPKQNGKMPEIKKKSGPEEPPKWKVCLRGEGGQKISWPQETFEVVRKQRSKKQGRKEIGQKTGIIYRRVKAFKPGKNTYDTPLGKKKRGSGKKQSNEKNGFVTRR